MQDPDARLNAVPTADTPPIHRHGDERRQSTGVDPTGKTSVIDLEFLAEPIPLLEAHDQLGGNGGAFCYVYV